MDYSDISASSDPLENGLELFSFSRDIKSSKCSLISIILIIILIIIPLQYHILSAYHYITHIKNSVIDQYLFSINHGFHQERCCRGS